MKTRIFPALFLIYFINHFAREGRAWLRRIYVLVATLVLSMLLYSSVVQVAEFAAGEQVGNSQLHRGGIRVSQWAAAIQGTERPGERSQQDPQQC